MEWYLIAKTLHIVAFVAWMAGMFYLPRLFVYHADLEPGSEAYELFKIMEQRLLKAIMTPAMIVTFVAGIWLAVITEAHTQGWFHVKILLVLIMAGLHGLYAVHRKAFLEDRNEKDALYFRLINEAPTVLLLIIVALAVLKPF